MDQRRLAQVWGSVLRREVHIQRESGLRVLEVGERSSRGRCKLGGLSIRRARGGGGLCRIPKKLVSVSWRPWSKGRQRYTPP